MMAAVNYTAASSRLRRSHSRSTTATLAISAYFPRQRALRRNYLRQKILKLLTHPIDSRPLQQVIEPVPKEIQECDESEIHKIQEIEVEKEVEISSEPTVGVTNVDANVGLLGINPVFKYGFWFAGAFALCAVWVFGSADSGSRNGKDPILENGQGESRVNWQTDIGNGVVYVDEVEMERKIQEIRAMATLVREKERVMSKNDGLESDSEEEDDNDVDAGKIDRSGIDLEVENRLIKLRKKLENERDRTPVASIGRSRMEGERRDGVGEGALNEMEGNAALLFKKKYKFKDFSSHQGEKPKGFRGCDEYSIHEPKKNGEKEKRVELLTSGNVGDNAVNLGGEGEHIDVADVDSKGNDPVHMVKEEHIDVADVDSKGNNPVHMVKEEHIDVADVDSKGNDPVHMVKEIKSNDTVKLTEPSKSARKKVEKERGMAKQVKRSTVAKPKRAAGLVPDKSRKSRGEDVKSIESGAVEVVGVSNELSDASRGKKVSSTKSARNYVPEKRRSDSEFWWSNLPYVLGILMYRSNDDTGGQGLYTLKSTPTTHGSSSHIVAFEDTVDATNFCYILQCFFEDVEDFRADVVPLTVKELEDAVKSETMSAIVVKRGELQLYAGQPLANAEMGLRDMIEEG